MAAAIDEFGNPVYKPPTTIPSKPGLPPGWITPGSYTTPTSDQNYLPPGFDPAHSAAPTAPTTPDVGPAPAPSVGSAGAPSPPGFTGAYGGIMAQNSASDAWAREQARNAIINFGDPALASMAGFGFDPQDAAFASQNYLSGNATLAKINHAHELARQAVINRLVSHGLLNSGDLGYQSQQEATQYGNQQYDARLSLLNYLSQLFAGSATSSNAARKALLTQQMGVTQ